MNPIAYCRTIITDRSVVKTGWNPPLAKVNTATIEPPIGPSPAPVVMKASGRRQNLLGRIFWRRQPAGPVARLRKRSFYYYLRRAKEPSAGQRRQSKTGLPPRPAAVADLHRFCRDLKVNLATLAVSSAFIACYCLLPTFRVTLGSYEPLACSTSVVLLLFSVLGVFMNLPAICRVRRAARDYADCVIATVDEKGHFAAKPGEDSDYAEYLEAYGPGSIILTQREYYEWMINNNPPVREVDHDFYRAGN